MEAILRGTFRRARAELGVRSFGMQVLDFPPNADGYPEHDHAEEGMEEVYVVLRGGGEIEVDGDRTQLDSETMVRVGPAAKRKLLAGPEGMRVLALGGVPGQVFRPKSFTEVGAPDPFAGGS